MAMAQWRACYGAACPLLMGYVGTLLARDFDGILGASYRSHDGFDLDALPTSSWAATCSMVASRLPRPPDAPTASLLRANRTASSLAGPERVSRPRAANLSRRLSLEDQPGVPLYLDIHILDQSTCGSVVGALIGISSAPGQLPLRRHVFCAHVPPKDELSTDKSEGPADAFPAGRRRCEGSGKHGPNAF